MKELFIECPIGEVTIENKTLLLTMNELYGITHHILVSLSKFN